MAQDPKKLDDNNNKKEELAWDVQPLEVWQFGLLTIPNLGEYGGGADIKIGSPVVSIRLPASSKKNIPKKILEILPLHINECIKNNLKLNKNDRIARLPLKEIDNDTILNKWKYTHHFVIHTYVPLCDVSIFNIMYQAWLFKDIPNQPNRLGCSLYPLIGIYEPINMAKPNANDVQYAGYNHLTYSDQHCHYDDYAWHFGSDMSKIIVNDNKNLSKFWSICVDHDNQQIDCSLIYIIKPELTSNIEALLRDNSTNPYLSKQNCKNFVDLFFGIFYDDLYNDDYVNSNKQTLAQELYLLLFEEELPNSDKDKNDNGNNNKNDKVEEKEAEPLNPK